MAGLVAGESKAGLSQGSITLDRPSKNTFEQQTKRCNSTSILGREEGENLFRQKEEIAILGIFKLPPPHKKN